MDGDSITESHCFLAYLTTLDKYFTADLWDTKTITSLSVLQAHIRLILPATSMEVPLAGGCLTVLNQPMPGAVKSLIDPN